MAHPTAALFCGDWVSVLRTWCFYGEKSAISDILESPKAVSVLGEHPL